MLDMGIIRRSQSSYAAPVVIVPKPDKSNRICIDFRKLNRLTRIDPEPMVAVQDVLEKMGGDRYYSTVDLSKGYWQIPVAKEDIHKTAFVVADGTYEFLRMPFGMVNAGATLVRGVRQLLHGLSQVDSYIDDIIIHTKTWSEHVEVLREVFRRLSDAGLTIRPSKCVLGADKVDFIGHQLMGGKMTPKENNIEKIRNAPRPTTKTEIRSFLGLTGFYREYIPHYSTIAAPLTDMTTKGKPQKVVWDETAEKAYTELKMRVTARPILQLPDNNKAFILRTDASDKGMGAMLLQEHEGKLFPVIFASKKLAERERRYSTMERECLAIIWAIRKFQLYLYGREFILQTDHQPLIYLQRAKFLNDRIMRWAMFLQNYSMKIESIKGKDNHGADFLSRADVQ